MPTRLLVLCCALALVLTALPVAATTYQARGCFGDAADDVVDLATGEPVDQPQADIAQWCVDYNGDTLTVALRAARATDPRTDPVWQDLAAAVAFVFYGEDGTGLVLNLGVPRGGGGFEYTVLTDSRVPDQLCNGPASLIDDVWTAAAPLADCFGTVGGLPDTLAIAAQLFYDLGPGGTTAEGAFDAAPDAGSVSVPRVVSPSPGVDRFAGAERVATVIQISIASFADGAADAVVLARSDVFADAVVAAPLAVGHHAPLLLTGQDTVSEAVLLEIQRVLGGAGDVMLLGGTSAIGRRSRTS
ncbi:MAG TPA: cell wall-binding repeat-containing protein [Euzebya sp.]|nr:cell wall-binding repeat-containing protein [Euzebya sp.]